MQLIQIKSYQEKNCKFLLPLWFYLIKKVSHGYTETWIRMDAPRMTTPLASSFLHNLSCPITTPMSPS